MEGKREITMRASKLVATIFTDAKRGGTTAVVKDKGLVVIFEVFGDGIKKWGAKIAVFGKLIAIFEVDNLDVWLDGGGFGFFGKRDKGVFGFSKVKVGNGGGGGAEDTGNI